MMGKYIWRLLCAALALTLMVPCALAESSEDLSGYNPFDPDSSEEQPTAVPTPLPMTDPFGTGSLGGGNLGTSLTDPFGTGSMSGGSTGGDAGSDNGGDTGPNTYLVDPFGTGNAGAGGSTGGALADPFGAGSTAPMLAAGTVMYVTSSTLKVTNQAAQKARTLATLCFGDHITVTATQGDWAQVQTANGRAGYCPAASLSATDPNVLNKAVYVQVTQTPMYKQPTTQTGRLRNLKKGDTVTMLAITSDGMWARVSDGTHFGFVPSVYLDDAPAAEGTVVWCGASSTPVMVNPESWIQIYTLSFGQQVRLVGYASDNTVAKIRNEKGYVAYCDVSALTTADPATLNMAVYAQATGKVLSSSASEDGRRYNIKKNVRLTLLGLDPSQTWALVKHGGRKQYIPYVFLGNERVGNGYRVVVATQDAPLYQAASTTSSVLGTLPMGVRLNLTGGDGMFAKVATMSDGVVQSVVGYLPLEYVRAE